MCEKEHKIRDALFDSRGPKYLNSKSRRDQPWQRTSVFSKCETWDKGPELRVGTGRRFWRSEEWEKGERERN